MRGRLAIACPGPLLGAVMGLRVSDNEEEVGLDISAHGERAYA